MIDEIITDFKGMPTYYSCVTGFLNDSMSIMERISYKYNGIG